MQGASSDSLHALTESLDDEVRQRRIVDRFLGELEAIPTGDRR